MSINTNSPVVSVIIPGYDREELIVKTIASVYRQEGVDFEIIVIDNGSKDNSIKVIKDKYPLVQLICNSRNLGTSYAKNQGIVRAKGKFLQFLDSDVELIKNDCIATMVKILDSNSDVGTLGSELYLAPSGEVLHKMKAITFNCETMTEFMDCDDYQLHEVGYVPTCNLMMKSKLMGRCGGFDSFIEYAGEDKELGIKVKNLGFKNVIDSRCGAYHFYSNSGRVSNFYLFNRNRIRIIIKNYPLYKVLLLPLLDCFSLVNAGKRLKSIKGKDVDTTRWKKGTDFSKKSMLHSTIILGLNYGVSMVLSYLWNMAHIISTLKIRLNQPNYLEEIKSGSSK